MILVKLVYLVNLKILKINFFSFILLGVLGIILKWKLKNILTSYIIISLVLINIENIGVNLKWKNFLD